MANPNNPNRPYPPFHQGPRQPQPPLPQKKKITSSLEKSDAVEVSGQANPSRKERPPVVTKELTEPTLYSETTITSLEDGTEIVKYDQPQKLNKLLKDAKAHLGEETSRFFGKGFVIGKKGVAKISPDGKAITFYPPVIADLIQDLLGPDSETI